MKKGISIWSFPAQSLQESFRLAKKAGYDGVELSLEENGEINMNSGKGDMELIRTQAKEAGIELYSVATSLHWNYSLTSADPVIREKA